MEAWPIAQSSLQKLNFGNTGQKTDKIRYESFQVDVLFDF